MGRPVKRTHVTFQTNKFHECKQRMTKESQTSTEMTRSLSFSSPTLVKHSNTPPNPPWTRRASATGGPGAHTRDTPLLAHRLPALHATTVRLPGTLNLDRGCDCLLRLRQLLLHHGASAPGVSEPLPVTPQVLSYTISHLPTSPTWEEAAAEEAARWADTDTPRRRPSRGSRGAAGVGKDFVKAAEGETRC